MKSSTKHRDLSQQVMITMRTRLRMPVTLVMLVSSLTFPLQSHGITLIQSNSVTNSFLVPVNGLVNTPNFQNAVPTINDTLLFNNNVTGAVNYRVSNASGANLMLGGLRVDNPGGAITLQNADNVNQTLSIGAQGIDMRRATQNLTISNTSATNSVTLNLLGAGSGAWGVNAGRTLTINSVVTGTGGLAIGPGLSNNGGTVLLGGTNSGTNTFTGATSVTGSTLQLDYATAGNRIDSAANLTLNRSTLTVQGGATFAQVVNGLTLGAGANQVTFGGTTANLNVGAITRTGFDSLLNVGTASRLTTTNTNVNGILGGWAVLNKTDWAVGGGAVTALATYVDRTGPWTSPGATSNARITGTVTAVGNDTIHSLKFNSGAFNLTQNAATRLNITSGGILKNDNNATTISGGTITAGGAADTVADTLYFWQNQNTMVVSSILDNNGTDVVNLVKAGDGSLRFDNAAAHTMTGTLTITGGRVLIGNGNTVGSVPGTNLVFAQTPGSLNGTATNDGLLTINRTDAVTLTQNISGVGGDSIDRVAIRKSAGTTLTLTPTSANTFFGITRIEAGSLLAGNATALSPNSVIQLADVAGVLLNLQNFNSTARGLTTGGAVGGNVTLGTANLTLAPVESDSLTYAGIISGTGGLVKNGLGSQTFTAGQTFTGPLTVNAGSLQATTLTPSSVTVTDGSLQATTVTTAGALNVTNGTFRGALVTTNPNVTVNGTGLVVLGSGSSLAANSSFALNNERSTLQLNNGSSTSVGSFVSAAGSQLALGNGASATNLTFNDTGSLNLNGVITMAGITGAGLGNVVKVGSANWVLSGGNGYTGSTTINAGEVQVSSGATVEVLPDRTDLTLANVSSVRLDLNGKNETIGSLAGGGVNGGNVLLGSGTLTTGLSGVNTTYAGAISGSGSVNKIGPGTLTLTGANTFTGALNISGGAVILNGGLLGDAANVSVSNASLNVNTSDTINRLTASQNSIITIGSGAVLTSNHVTEADVTSTVAASNDFPIINVAGGTQNLAVGMSIRDVNSSNDIPGAYIVQILNANQVLMSNSTASSGASPAKTFAFGSVSQVAASLKGSGDWVKNGNGNLLLGSNGSDMTGTMTFNGGAIIAGGFNLGGRNQIQDTISNSAQLSFGSVNPVTFNLAVSPVNLMPFERIGSLSGGGSGTVLNLVGLSSSGALALGGNNQSTTFNGAIRGSISNTAFTGSPNTNLATVVSGNFPWLIKEGTGTLDWTNDDTNAIRGTVRVDRGMLKVGGSVGLDAGSNAVLSNAPGAKLSLQTSDSAGEELGFISGGGRGASRSFSNGVSGALLGNYLVGGTSEIQIGTATGTATNAKLLLSNNLVGQIYSFAGNITGDGSLEKNGNNTLEVLGANTYAGDTIIRNTATAGVSTSTIAIGAYSGSAGVGALGSGGYGQLPSTTSLSMIAGASLVAGVRANVQFDLNGATQTLSALSVQNTGGNQTINLGGGTININTPATGVSNGFFAGLFNGRGTINVNSTSLDGPPDNRGWYIESSSVPNTSPEVSSNTSHIGSFNVNGGRVVLNGPDGSLGDTVHVSVGSQGTLAVQQADTTGSLFGAGALQFINVLTPTLTLTSAPKGPITSNVWSGTTTGTGNLSLTQTGRLSISSNQAFIGRTTVRGASELILNYSTGANATNNIIPGTLTLAGGRIQMRGGDSTVTDEVTSTLLESGATVISGSSSGTRLGLGQVTRQAGGILEVRGASVVMDAPSAGLLGGYATFARPEAVTNVLNVTTWATLDDNGLMTDLLNSGYETNPASMSGSTFDVTAASDPNGNVSFNWESSDNVNSLRFNTPNDQASISVTLYDTDKIINDGGILVTKNIGPRDIRIRDELDSPSGRSLTGGGGLIDDELIVHQHNTLGSLKIEVPIVDNPNSSPNALTFSKTGQGKVILTGNNSYTGSTNIFAGSLQLGEGGGGGSLGSGAITNNGYLILNRSTGGTIAPEINGTGGVIKRGAGTETLGGTSSNYTGTVSILSGTLVAGASTLDAAFGSLGSPKGLTSVAANAALEIQSSFVTNETIFLRGGNLNSGTVGGTLRGPVLLGENGTILSKSASVLSLAGPVISRPGTTLALTGPGDIVLANTSNQMGAITLGGAPGNPSLTRLFIGAGFGLNGTPGSVGRTAINNRGSVILNVNDTHFVLGSTLSGTGTMVINRGNIYLTGDNSYSGATLVGGNGSSLPTFGLTINNSAELRVGNDTYTGKLGSGALIVQSATTAESAVRFHTLRNQSLSNIITLNPSPAGTTARNARLHRQGLGSLTLNGSLIAGSHGAPVTNTQRATVNNTSGGKLTLAGPIVTSSNNRLNFAPSGNSVTEIAGSLDRVIWGRFLNSTDDNTTTVTAFNVAGTTTLKGFNNFGNLPAPVTAAGENPGNNTNRFQNIYIQRGVLEINHSIEPDPENPNIIIDSDAAGVTANPTNTINGVDDEADFYVLRGAAIRFAQTETAGYFATQKGSAIEVVSDKTLTINDSGVNHVINGGLTGGGTVRLSALGGNAWFGLFGPSSIQNSVIIGSSTNSLTGGSTGANISTVRVNDLGANSGLGQSPTIRLGVAAIPGASTQEARLEYVSRNGPAAQVTNKDFELSNSDVVVVKMTAQFSGVNPSPSVTTTVLTLEDVGSIVNGMAVNGPGIAPNTRVQSIAGNTVTIAPKIMADIGPAVSITFEDLSSTGVVRIAAGGVGALVIGSDPASAATSNGKITATNVSRKQLILHGQNAMGNTINGMIDQGGSVALDLSVNPDVTDNDQYGAGRWILKNVNNNFSGNISVAVGSLEFAGDLGSGNGTSGPMGNLTAARVINLGTNDFNGRRYDIFGGGDNLGAAGGLSATGTIIFNDANAGTLTLGSNIGFTQSFSSTTNPGSGEIINNGNKVVVINGAFTSGASGNRNWILDGTNTGDNRITGSISNGSGNSVGITKEGAGKWILDSTNNSMNGTITVNRGELEVAGVSSIGDDALVTLTNAGSDGSSVGGAALRLRSSETIGGLAGTVGTTVQLDAGVLTLRNAVQTFSGSISGAGGITRTNNDGTARDATFANKNTYTGPTRIITNGTNFVANRLNVYHLNNGASSIGNATDAAANLVIDTNTGGGGLRYLGFTNQSTSRLFTIGSGANAAHIWADGSVIGTTAPSIEFSNAGAIAFAGAADSTQTLTLRGATLSDNRFAPQLTNNGTGATSLAKADAGLWIISNAANSFTGGTTITGGTLAITSGTALGAGAITINGGAGVGLEIRGGMTLANAITNSTASGGLVARTGSSSLTGLLTLTANIAIGVDQGASLAINNAASAITGAGQLQKFGAGTLTLSGVNGTGWTGGALIRGGTLVLDYSTNNGSKLPDAGVLTLGGAGGVNLVGVDDNIGGASNIFGTTGGTLSLVGNSASAEVIGSTTLAQGANAITRSSGSAVINLAAVTRAVGSGATLDFNIASIATTTNLNGAGGILTTTGGAAGTATGAYATVGKANWAVTAASGTSNPITALATYGADTYSSNTNTNITQAAATTAAATTNTLRFNAAQATTLTLTGTLSLQSAGVLVTPNVGAFPTIITGSAIQNAAGTANLEALIIHQHNTAGALQINSIIQNNTSAQQITKSGLGKVFLNALNTQTGALNLNEGELQVGGTAAAPNTATAATLGGANVAINMSQGSTLTFLSNNVAVQDLNTIQGGGTITLATGNTMPVLMDTDNANFFGEIIVGGGTLRAANNNALGSNRGTTVINNTGTLQIDTSVTLPELITYNQGAILTTLPAAAATLNARQTFSNTTASGLNINIPAPATVGSVGLNITGIIYAANGFTKSGDGILQLGANQFTNVLDGYTTANASASLVGQILVNQGELRLGNARALGATGVGNETVVAAGATVDLRGQVLNYGDDPDLSREIFRVAGAGVNGLGAIRNTSGTGQFSHLVLTGNSTISGGGSFNGSRLDLSAYDSNVRNGSLFDGNFTRREATLEGGNSELTIVGAGAVVLHQPTFGSALSKINVREGILRLEMDVPVNSSGLWAGLKSANVTNGIEIAYAGPSAADQTNVALGNGPNVGARLNLFRNWDARHTVNITMNGVTAKGAASNASGGGYNYIDTGADTIPSPRTYLDGNITVLGDASRNIFHNDSSSSNNSVVEQGNLTGSLQTKLIVGGVISGSGGFTKTGTREVRLTNNNTLTGEVNVLRTGTVALGWQSNTVNVNGVNFNTFGDGEGWAEYGLTLAGSNASLSRTSAITLQRQGMITLDNTTRLDASSGGVTGGNNDDRINNAASINFDHGWLRIHGSSTTANNEALATTGGAINVRSGTNLIDLWPADGSSQTMTLTIGAISRSAGSVLRFRDLDATSTFGSATPESGKDSVRVALTNASGLTAVGSGTSATNRSIYVGLFGGIIPHGYLEDVRELGYNNANVSDLFNQGRNQQLLAGSHFMTLDSGFLRPLDDSEYFTPTDGILKPQAGGGQNVNLTDVFTIVQQNMSINALRFGPTADSDGSGTNLNNGTTVTSYNQSHSNTLIVDGTLSISSGMISSAYFTVGNTTNSGTVIQGGTLDFGTREAIINNQNGFVRLTDGTVQGGNLEIRSNIAGLGGLTKTGFSQVTLDGQNSFSGIATVSEGNLILRNGRFSGGVGGAGNGFKVEGSGNLLTSSGINVGSASSAEDILVGILQGDQTVFQVQNDLTNFFGDIIVDNVDAAGQIISTPRFNVSGGNSALIINGDIYGGTSAVSNDVTAIDSRLITTAGSNNGYITLRGQVGDRGDNGVAKPVANVVSSQQSSATVTNENEVLRFQVTGNNDLNVTMERQYAAAGRLTLDQGVLNLSYDPNAAGNEGSGFWTTTALSKIQDRNSNVVFNASNTTNTSQQGFVIGGAGNTALFLGQSGKDGIAGQNFNMASWRVAAGNITHVGGINETGAVTFGDGTGSLSLDKGVRLYAMGGGTVNLNMRLNGGQVVQKVGRGTLVLQNTGLATASDTNSLELGGGTFVIDHSGTSVARFGNAGNFTFRGGRLLSLGRADATVTSSYGTDTGASRTIAFTSGGSEIVAQTTAAQNLTINLGNTSATNGNLTRGVGATANFVENQSLGGVAAINLAFGNTSVISRNRLISWATYGNASRTALDFAMVNGNSGNRVQVTTRAPEEFQNNVASWIGASDTSEIGGAGFNGTLAASLALNTLRFDTMADSVVNLGGNSLSVTGDEVAGAILVSSNTGASNKSIINGQINNFDPGADTNYNITYSGISATNSRLITAVTSLTGLVVGMPISGSNIPSGSVVTAITAPSTVEISNNATGSATSAFTFNRLVGSADGNNVSSPANRQITNLPSTTGLLPGMNAVGLPNVTAVQIINGGSGYTSAPSVTISGGGGSGATASATVSGGVVTAIIVTASGTGYTSEPSIAFSGGAGTGATAKVIVPAAVIPAGSYITAVDANSITLSAQLTATANGIAFSAGSGELILHQYGQGNLTIGAAITGAGSLTVAGPTTTNASEFNTTGTVRLTGANTYTGRTFINGSVLEIGSISALGTAPAAAPNTAASNNQLTMNGGTLRWTGGVGSLGTRGVRLEGSGGVIEVSSPNGNLSIGDGVSGTQGQIVSEDAFRGDLIKTGPGTLTLQGPQAVTFSGATAATAQGSLFQGLLDIRQGALVIASDTGSGAAATTTSLLGTNRGWADGTIFRQGTNFQALLGNGNNNGDWTIEEFMTFEGGNTFTYNSLLDTTAAGQGNGVANLGNRRALNLNGVTNIAGSTTFDIGGLANAAGQVFPSTNGNPGTTNLPIVRIANNSGYLTGNGDIVKDGQGQLEFRANSPEWKGNLIIKQGNVYAANQADVFGTGYTTGKTITLGDAERQGMAQLLIQNPDNIQNWLFDIKHDINVVYNPTQTKRIGIDNVANGNRVSFDGNITLNDNLIVLLQDGSISSGGEQAILNFNGQLRDGLTTSGNITIQTNDSGGPGAGGANDNTNGRMAGYAVLNANNSAWTGDVTISALSSYDHDKTSVLRLGHDSALTAANDVTMNFNSILQVGGRTATIGSLRTLGGNGSFNGDAGTMSASSNGSSEIIENASETAAALTIMQSTPATFEVAWDAKFRNGTLNSQFFSVGTNTHLPSAALSLVKAGSGWSVLTLDNDYTGTTTVAGGILQVGRDGVGDTGANNAAGTTVNSGAVLAGTGWVQGGLTVQSGAIVSPGDAGGAALGTLNVNGTALFAAGSKALLQVKAPTYNNPGVVDALDANYSRWLNGTLDPITNQINGGIALDEFSHGLKDVVTKDQHDMIYAGSTGTINLALGSQIELVSDGYTPKAGDIFHLFNAGTLGVSLNRGANIRVGNETGTDLNLFELGGNLRWDTSLLNTLGILAVVTTVTDVATPPPTIVSGPTAKVEGNPDPLGSTVLTPPATFTVDCRVNSTSNVPITIQWLLNGVAEPELAQLAVLSPANGIPAGDGVTSTLTLTASSLTKGIYSFIASNGTQVFSSTVEVFVNDQPVVSRHPVSRLNQMPSIGINSVPVEFSAEVIGPGPYTAEWFKVVNGVVSTSPIFVETAGVVSSNKWSSLFAIPAITETDEGEYFCRFTSNADVPSPPTVSTNRAQLTVNDAVSNVVATRTRNPDITYQGETITFSVTANGGSTLRYQWFKNNQPIAGATKSTFVTTYPVIVPYVPTDDSYFVRVTNIVNDPDGTSFTNAVQSNTLSLPVRNPIPVLVSSTAVHRTLLAGGSLNMAVAAVGRPDIRYTWKRSGTTVLTDLIGVFAANPVAIANGGTYTCEVTNPTTTKITTVPTEIVVVDSATRMIPVKLGASTFSLTANVGRGPKTNVNYKWFKRVIEPGVEPEDPPIVTDTAVSIIDTRITGEEQIGTLAKPSTTTNVLKFTGTATAPITLADDGLYVCKVTGPDGVSVDGCFYDVRVYNAAPINITSTTLTRGVVGGFYTERVLVDPARNLTPVTYSATGLPTGLTIDKTTGVISGVPTASGPVVNGVPTARIFTVTTWASNLSVPADSNKIVSTIQIDPIPMIIPGVYAGPIERHPVLNGNLGGRFDMTVTATGGVSGRITFGTAAARAFKGVFSMSVGGGGIPTAPTASIVIPATATLPALTVSFGLTYTAGTPSGTLLTNAQITSGSNSVAFTGWRNLWAAKAVAGVSAIPTSYSAKATDTYNFAFMMGDTDPLRVSATQAVPQGAGYGSFKVTTTGAVAVTGRTPDGETLTSSCPLGPDGQLFLFRTLYTTKDKGSLLSKPDFKIDTRSNLDPVDNDITGGLTIVRPPNPAAVTTARTYRSGFGTTLTAAGVTPTTVTAPVNYVVTGGRYIAPLPVSATVMNPTVLLDLPAGSNNAEVLFDENGTGAGGGIAAAFNPDMTIGIGAASKLTVPKKSLAHPAGTTLTATAASGVFSGRYTLEDTNPVALQTPTKVTRNVTYQGLVIRSRGVGGATTTYGVGYFIVDQLPQTGSPATTTKTAPRVSGLVTLRKIVP